MNPFKRAHRTGTLSNPQQVARGLLSDGSFAPPHRSVRTLGFSAVQGPATHVGPATHSPHIQAGPGGAVRPPGGTGHRLPANSTTTKPSSHSSLHQQIGRLTFSDSSSSFHTPPSARASQPGPFEHASSADHGVGKGKGPVPRGLGSTLKPGLNQPHPLPPGSTGQVGFNTPNQRSQQPFDPHTDLRSHTSGPAVASSPSTHSGSPYSGSSSSGGKLPGSLSTSMPRHLRDSPPQNLGPQGGVKSSSMEKGKRPQGPTASTSTSRIRPSAPASTSSRTSHTAENKYNLYTTQLNTVMEQIRAVRRNEKLGNLRELESTRVSLKSLMKTNQQIVWKARNNQHWKETGSIRTR